jgi:hypothetical protein
MSLPKPKLKLSEKKLKSNRFMKFLKRETLQEEGKTTKILDYFLLREANIVLIRKMSKFYDRHNTTIDHQYVSWTCPELGGGTASFAYWVELARKRPQHNTR